MRHAPFLAAALTLLLAASTAGRAQDFCGYSPGKRYDLNETMLRLSRNGKVSKPRECAALCSASLYIRLNPQKEQVSAVMMSFAEDGTLVSNTFVFLANDGFAREDYADAVSALGTTFKMEACTASYRKGDRETVEAELPSEYEPRGYTAAKGELQMTVFPMEDPLEIYGMTGKESGSGEFAGFYITYTHVDSAMRLFEEAVK